MTAFPSMPAPVDSAIDLTRVNNASGASELIITYDYSTYNQANPYNYPDLNVINIIASTAIDSAPSVVRCDCTSGAITVTLPYAQSVLGKIIYIAKVDSGANAVTLAVNSGDTLWKPAALGTLTAQHQVCAFASVWDGTNNGWQCISAS
jgi:hypothetical protein